MAFIVVVLSVAAGGSLKQHLKSGGYTAGDSESARGTSALAHRFGLGSMDLILTVSSDHGVLDSATASYGRRLVERLSHDQGVARVVSPWSASPGQARSLVGNDGKRALVLVGLNGDEDTSQQYARAIAGRESGDHGGIRVSAGGTAMLYVQVNDQSQADLLLAEAIAIPLTFLVLVLVFGGVVAALLPLLVGLFAITGTLAILRGLTLFADVSTFALNLTTALAFALAVDYSLLFVSRYREEVRGGLDREAALCVTVQTAGRTIAASCVTVAVCLVPMSIFPIYFLRSFTYAGVAVVILAGFAAAVVLPAVVSLLGGKIDALNVGRLIRRRRVGQAPNGSAQSAISGWYRWASMVTRRPLIVGGAALLILIVLGFPIVRIHLAGYSDDRVLPQSLSARQVGDELRADFAHGVESTQRLVLTSIGGDSLTDVERYASQLSTIPNVSSVTSPGSTFVDGRRVGGPAADSSIRDGAALLTFTIGVDPFSDAAAEALATVHRVPAPRNSPVIVTGPAQINVDAKSAVLSRLPLALGLLALLVFVLILTITRSLVLSVKALVVNTLSLSATFGALVWIFQQGHLSGLGTTVTGSLIFNIVALLFCLSFGISMDYELFILTRIREYFFKPGPEQFDNGRSIVSGMDTSGRVVTAAALLMLIVFSGLMASSVTLLRMLGLGLFIAVLIDATVVRTALVPAFMSVAGQLNWWTPGHVNKHVNKTERLVAREGVTQP
jgi:RND superfamily putative drug exporter